MDVAVIGCGVSGLTCAIELQEKNDLSVQIYARDLPAQTTSNKAGAVWFPYRANPPHRVHDWSRVTYQRLKEISQCEGRGVYMVEMMEVYASTVDRPWWYTAVPEGAVRVASPEEVPENYQCGWLLRAPQIEPPRYLQYLMDRFVENGGKIHQVELSHFKDLFDRYSIIVNCSGLGAREVASDSSMFPIQGHMIQVRHEGDSRTYFDDTSSVAPAYIMPRHDLCVLGGTAEDGDWNTEVRLDRIGDILTKCCRLNPEIAHSEIIGTYVGLRPGRPEVRLEVESFPDHTVVHNYGHGGSGFTLSWGCAAEVQTLVGKAVSQEPSPSLTDDPSSASSPRED